MRAFLFGLVLTLATSTAALAESNWRVAGAPGDTVFSLTTTANAEKGVTWTFQCEADTVALMQTGVTDLMDIQNGQKVSDEPGSTMSPGAAVMGLMSDKANSGFLSALARPNPRRGWDLLVRLPKKDRALRGMAKARMVVVMTTGFTIAVEIGPEDRPVIADFLTRCLKS